MYHTACCHLPLAAGSNNDRIIPPTNQLQAWERLFQHPRTANGGCPLPGRGIIQTYLRPMDKPLNPMDKQLIAARFAKARNTIPGRPACSNEVAER